MTDVAFGCESARRRTVSVRGLTLAGLEWGEAEIPGAWHHLVLDQPDAFTAALAGFLR